MSWSSSCSPSSVPSVERFSGFTSPAKTKHTSPPWRTAPPRVSGSVALNGRRTRPPATTADAVQYPGCKPLEREARHDPTATGTDPLPAPLATTTRRAGPRLRLVLHLPQHGAGPVAAVRARTGPEDGRPAGPGHGERRRGHNTATVRARQLGPP